LKLRPYQQEVLDQLWDWFTRHADGNPIVEAAVGAGKSLMIAALAQRCDREAPGTRILVLVHQKELLEQNVDKLLKVWPQAYVGIYSAAANRRQLGRQLTYATIGSVYKIAHLLGRVDIVLADECHLINPRETGMWRGFLADLARYNPTARTIGWTGTPFRGNGVWLTAGKDALFTHIATAVKMRKLLELGFLSPLTPAETTVRVQAEGVRTSGDDYVVSELAKITDKRELVEATASEICKLAAERRRWLVFAVTIEHAEHVQAALQARGVACAVVSADTPKAERQAMIQAFRSGALRCLVNVAVLTTGFDVPEVDFIALLRATKSPVLYVQIAGRGMRLAPGKRDCLWADFTDTTARLGPVDAITGRPPAPKGGGGAPWKVCPACGSRNLAAARVCCDCGHEFPEVELIKHGQFTNGAAILSEQMENAALECDLTEVRYAVHQKFGSPDTMRVSYWDRLNLIAEEWVTFDHAGYNRMRAESWWSKRAVMRSGVPSKTADAVVAANGGALRVPLAITVAKKPGTKFPEIVGYKWADQ
jgi:DNA repair protein RadD